MSSITIYRFNSYFYTLLKQPLLFILKRPKVHEQDNSDECVISQVCGSEYPEDIYHDLVE